MATDPVCNMTVEPGEAAAETEYNGETYYFCSIGCRKAFEIHPEKYLQTGAERETETTGGQSHS